LGFRVDNGLRPELQHRVPHACDFQDRHACNTPFPFEIWAKISPTGSLDSPSQAPLPVLHTAPINGRPLPPGVFLRFQPAGDDRPTTRELGAGPTVQVLVRDNNVDQALRALKKKMQREGIFREMKMRRNYEKPSERKAREKAEAVRRHRKLLRKRLEREGY
jgi:small subunit ribosomal protein S21